MRHSKLEGGKPLKDFQILSHNSRAYVVLSDIPTGKLEPQKKTALLLGDTVEKGQASVYTLTMEPNGKEILDVSRTKDTVRLYGSAKKTILKRGEGNHYPPHTEAVHQQRQTEVLGKINHFLEKPSKILTADIRHGGMMKIITRKKTNWNGLKKKCTVAGACKNIETNKTRMANCKSS